MFILWPLKICINNLSTFLNHGLLLISAALAQSSSSTSGPVFIQEPPNQVDFSNTTGTEIICQSRGFPLPQITWVKTDGTPVKDVPGLRQVRIFFKKSVTSDRNYLMFFNTDQSQHLFSLFSSFSHSNINCSFNFNNINWKKRRWFVWDSNPGLLNGRRKHGAMVAAQSVHCVSMWTKH